MTEVYLVCAPETETELFRFLQGRAESPLSPQGALQCRALVECFRERRPDRVYASCQGSAWTAAEAIAALQGGEVEQVEALNELDLGAWDGCAAGNLAFDDAEMYRRFRDDLFRWGAAGAEDVEDAATRIETWVRQAVLGADGEAIVVVSHRYILRLLMTRLFGPEVSGEAAGQTTLWRLFGNGSVTRVAADGDTFFIVAENETDHVRAQRALEDFPEHREPDFDSTLYYQWLRAVEYGDLFADAVESVWEEAGQTGPFRRFDLIDDASRYETIVGYAEQIPAGFLQYGMRDGTIQILLSHPGARGVGIGPQLVGKAVMDARARGWDRLTITLPEQNPYRRFFENLGFESLGETKGGEAQYVKMIM